MEIDHDTAYRSGDRICHQLGGGEDVVSAERGDPPFWMASAVYAGGDSQRKGKTCPGGRTGSGKTASHGRSIEGSSSVRGEKSGGAGGSFCLGGEQKGVAGYAARSGGECIFH